MVGDQVLILEAGQGRDLLEANGIKVEPTTQPSDSFNDQRNAKHGAKPNGKTAAPSAPAAAPSAAAPHVDKSASAMDSSSAHRQAAGPTTLPTAQT
jgi:hypothetical protein